MQSNIKLKIGMIYLYLGYKFIYLLKNKNKTKLNVINFCMQTNQTLENTKIVLRKELKDMKLNEARLDSEYSELEEENCSLQKQVRFL